MNIQELMNRIKMSKETQKYCFDHLLDEKEYKESKELFYENTTAFFEKWKLMEKHLQWILPFYLQLSLEVYEKYQSKEIEEAEEFFGDTYHAYMCDSWLLSPVLKEFIPETSNIIRFQNLFEIIKVHHDYPQGEERIFKDVRTDKENYPEESILQKKAKEYILSGKDLGIGVGVFMK